MGACARGKASGEKLAINMAPLVWKQLLGHEIRWDDVAELEPELARKLSDMQQAPISHRPLCSDYMYCMWEGTDLFRISGRP
jgi:hypothetical protein